MNVAQTYIELKAPALTVHDYYGQASVWAVGKFKELDTPKLAQFFLLLGQAYKEKSSAYQFLFKNVHDIQADKQQIPAQHLKPLMAVLPRCLEAEDQATLLRYELLNYLQNHKLAITRKFSLTTDVQKAFDTYSKYLAGIYYIGSTPSIWFSELAYEAADRRELIEAFMYIQVLKLKASVSHFKKDILLISQKAHNLSKKVLYFIDFMGIEVEVVGKKYDLNRLNVYDEMPLPTFRGKFAAWLNQYMTDELAQEDYATVLRETQEAVLANDLGKAILHYKNHNTLNTRADISFALQGGAGIVRLEIRSWLNRILVGDFRWYEKYLLPVILSIAFVWYAGSGVPLMLLGFAYANAFSDKKNARNIIERELQEEKDLDLTYLREPHEEAYKKMVEAHKVETGYILLNQNIFSNLKENIHEACLIHAKLEFSGYSYVFPTDVQEIYHRYNTHLQTLEAGKVKFPPTFEEQETEKQAYFEAARYILALEYNKSRQHFNALMDLLIQNKEEAIYYHFFLNLSCSLNRQFYGITYEPLDYLTRYARELFYEASPFKVYLSKRLEYNKLLAYLPPTSSNEWILQEENALKNSLQDIELAKVRQYLQFLEQSRTTPHLRIQPFLLEGEEGVLFI